LKVGEASGPDLGRSAERAVQMAWNLPAIPRQPGPRTLRACVRGAADEAGEAPGKVRCSWRRGKIAIYCVSPSENSTGPCPKSASRHGGPVVQVEPLLHLSTSTRVMEEFLERVQKVPRIFPRCCAGVVVPRRTAPAVPVRNRSGSTGVDAWFPLPKSQPYGWPDVFLSPTGSGSKNGRAIEEAVSG